MSSPGKCCFGFLMCLLITPLFAQTVEKTRAVDGLIYDLKHPEGDRRKDAARVLGKNRVREAVPELMELTQDTDDLIRLEAVRALVSINDTRALSVFIRLTQDRNAQVQDKSVEGIVDIYVVEESGFVGGIKKFVGFINPLHDDYDPLIVESYIPVSQDAVRSLARLLLSPRTDVRKNAARALGILRGHSVLPEIQEALSREALSREVDNGVKVELIWAVYKIADPKAAETLIPLIHDPDKKVHDEAILTLGRLRVAKAVPVLMDLYQSGVQERKTLFGIVPASGSDDLLKKIFEALAYVGAPESKDLFVDSLEREEAYFRRYAAEGLGRIGDRSLATLLGRHHLSEKSATVRLALGFALYRLGRDEHLLELVRSMEKGDQGFDYLLELEADKVPKLYPYIRIEKDSVKARLIEIVGLRGDESALPIVREVIESDDADVVSSANLAMRRIQGRSGS